MEMPNDWVFAIFFGILNDVENKVTSIVFSIIICILKKHQRLREYGVSIQSKEENRDAERIIA